MLSPVPGGTIRGFEAAPGSVYCGLPVGLCRRNRGDRGDQEQEMCIRDRVRIVTEKYLADLSEFQALCTEQFYRERARGELDVYKRQECVRTVPV